MTITPNRLAAAAGICAAAAGAIFIGVQILTGSAVGDGGVVARPVRVQS